MGPAGLGCGRVVVVVDLPASGDWCRLVSYYRKGKEMQFVVRVQHTDVVAYRVEADTIEEAEKNYADGEPWRTEMEEDFVLEVMTAEGYPE